MTDTNPAIPEEVPTSEEVLAVIVRAVNLVAQLDAGVKPSDSDISGLLRSLCVMLASQRLEIIRLLHNTTVSGRLQDAFLEGFNNAREPGR